MVLSVVGECVYSGALAYAVDESGDDVVDSGAGGLSTSGNAVYDSAVYVSAATECARSVEYVNGDVVFLGDGVAARSECACDESEEC